MCYDTFQMDLKDAILNLTSQDPALYEQAFLVCKHFQMPEGFDFQLFCQMILPENEIQFRYFGFNSLKIMIMQYWNQLNPDFQQSIASIFPFYQNFDVNDPILPIVIDSASLFLLYCSNDELLTQYFSSSDLFANDVISNLIIELGTNQNAYQRTPGLTNLYNNSHEVIFERFILPLTASTDIDPKIFEILGRIHDLETHFITKILALPRVDEIYSRFAEYVWIPDSPPGLISIFMSILSHGLCPHSANAIADAALIAIPKIYEILFITEGEIEYGIVDQYIGAFCNRIQLFFMSLPKIDYSKLNVMFDFITKLFNTSSPTAMLNIVKELTKTLRSPEFRTEEFANALLEERMKIVDICSIAISIDLRTLYLASLDYEADTDALKTSFYQLIQAISEIFDSSILCVEISQLIISKDTSQIYGLIRLLYNVIVPPNEDNINIVKGPLSAVFDFIFTNMGHIKTEIQEYAYKLLTKISPYLELDGQQATFIFNQILQNVCQQNARSYDPITVFLLDFTTLYISEIEFPVEQLAAIQHTEQYSWVIKIILAKLSVAANFDFLGDSIPLAIELIGQIVNDENICGSINYKIGRILEFLSLVPGECLTESLCNQIVELLLVLLNRVISLNEHSTNIARAFHHVNRALLHILEFVPALSVECLQKLTSPELITTAVDMWMSETVLKVVKIASEVDSEQTSRFCCDLILHLFKMMEQTDEDMASAVNQVSLSVSSLTSFVVDDESATSVYMALFNSNNARLYEQVVGKVKQRGFPFFAQFWPVMISRKGNKEFDTLTLAIFDYIENGILSFADLSRLNGVNEADLNTLVTRYQGSTAAKTKKKHIKNFIIAISNSL